MQRVMMTCTSLSLPIFLVLTELKMHHLFFYPIDFEHTQVQPIKKYIFFLLFENLEATNAWNDKRLVQW